MPVPEDVKTAVQAAKRKTPAPPRRGRARRRTTKTIAQGKPNPKHSSEAGDKDEQTMPVREPNVVMPAPVHKRKSVSPQKRFISPLSPEYVDMPLFSLTPQKQDLSMEHAQLPELDRQTIKSPSASRSATITGAQKRKLMSPNKKRVKRAVFGFDFEPQENIHFNEAVGEPSTSIMNKSGDLSPRSKFRNTVLGGSSGNIISVENFNCDSPLENIIHIYPQDEYSGFGMENQNVAKPIFTVNTSPTKYMGSDRHIESLSTAKTVSENRVPGKKTEEAPGDADDLVKELGITIQQ